MKTVLIQPIDQNVIQNIKLNYCKSLLVNVLADLVRSENLVVDALIKAINLIHSFLSCKKLEISLSNAHEQIVETRFIS